MAAQTVLILLAISVLGLDARLLPADPASEHAPSALSLPLWLSSPLSQALSAVVLVALVIVADGVADRIAANMETGMTTALSHALVSAQLADRRRTRSEASVAMIATEGIASVAGYMTGYLPAFLEVLLMIPVSVALLAALNGWAALAIALGMLLLPMAAMLSRKRDIAVQMQQLGLYENVGDEFSEALQGMTSLKIFHADGRAAQRLRDRSEGFRAATMDVLRGQLSALIGADTVIALAVTAAVALAALTGRTPVAALLAAVAVAICSIRLFGPERQLVYLSHSAAVAMRHAREIDGLLHGETATPATDPDSGQHPAQQPSQPSFIRARDLSFAYPDGHTALERLSFDLPSRGHIGIVGQSGSGKSTLVSILSGQLGGEAGTIQINGRDIGTIPYPELIRMVTVDHGNDRLLSGTIRTALDPAGRGFSDDELRRALDLTGMASELDGRGGLDAPVSMGGSNFSGGQRQRLSISRALLRQTPIYLFDEATSAVDRRHEAQISSLIDRLSKKALVVTIAHRLSCVRNADEIYVLDHGRIHEKGTCAELLRTGGLFARQWRQQAPFEQQERQPEEQKAEATEESEEAGK